MNINTVILPSNGHLIFLESERTVNFHVKRMYVICGVKAGEHRGYHAHKNLKQVLFCPYGKIEILLDDGKERASIILDSPQKGLIIEKEWREILWLQDNSVLCVLASDYYDEDDYIRDYDDFLRSAKCK